MSLSFRALAVFTALAASAAHCDYWYRIPLSVFSMVQYPSQSKIVLTAPDGLMHQVQESSNGTFSGSDLVDRNKDQIEIHIPAGLEKAWLSMVLTAFATGQRIQFNGDLAASIVTNVNSGDKRMMILP